MLSVLTGRALVTGEMMIKDGKDTNTVILAARKSISLQSLQKTASAACCTTPTASICHCCASDAKTASSRSPDCPRRRGTVEVGTVDLGTVELGTVDMGTVDLGTVEMGRQQLITVEVGTLAARRQRQRPTRSRRRSSTPRTGSCRASRSVTV